MAMTEEERDYFERELAHAQNLVMHPTFDSVADAAETLTRAANRLAPPGHSVRFVRSDHDLPAIELAERLGRS